MRRFMVEFFQKRFGKSFYYSGFWVLSLVIFFFDTRLELGISSGPLYVILVLISLFTGHRVPVYLAASLGSLLTIAGFFFSPTGGEVWKVIINRSLAIFLIWATAALAVAYQKRNEKIKDDSIRLSNKRTRLFTLLNNTVDGIITINQKGQIQSINPAALKLFQYAENEVLFKNIKTLMPDPWASEHDDYLQKYLTTGETKIIGTGREVMGLRKDGSTFHLDLSISHMKIDGETMFTGILRDITERKASERELKNLNALLQESNKQLELLSYKDPLTKIYNRRYFDEQIGKEWSRCQRLGLPISLIMFDIDFFKSINDEYGHPFGDQVLIEIARKIQSQIKRPGDVLSRIGGEEFAVILSTTELKGAVRLAKQLGDSVRDLKFFPENEEPRKRVTISLGIASVIPKGQSVDSLVEMADKALYQAKENGRDRYEIFEGVPSDHSDPSQKLASVKEKDLSVKNPQI